MMAGLMYICIMYFSMKLLHSGNPIDRKIGGILLSMPLIICLIIYSGLSLREVGFISLGIFVFGLLYFVVKCVKKQNHKK